MGHLKMVVDHEKIEYSGPFNANDLFRMIDNFVFERGFDKRQDKDFEHSTPTGKFIEWQISPWKKITDYIRYIIKVRVLCYELLKTDVVAAIDEETGKPILNSEDKPVIRYYHKIQEWL